eukprot:10384654-Prorocentrum_lima.AAC.1
MFHVLVPQRLDSFCLGNGRASVKRYWLLNTPLVPDFTLEHEERSALGARSKVRLFEGIWGAEQLR